MSRLIIIGSGVKEKADFYGSFEIMTINKEIRRYRGVKHHISLHDLASGMAISHRRKVKHKAMCTWDYKDEGGTSGLFALFVALKLGYDKIALWGIPLSGTYGNPAVTGVWKRFIENNDCGNVRSFHGKTKKYLGDAKGWF